MARASGKEWAFCPCAALQQTGSLHCFGGNHCSREARKALELCSCHPPLPPAPLPLLLLSSGWMGGSALTCYGVCRLPLGSPPCLPSVTCRNSSSQVHWGASSLGQGAPPPRGYSAWKAPPEAELGFSSDFSGMRRMQLCFRWAGFALHAVCSSCEIQSSPLPPPFCPPSLSLAGSQSCACRGHLTPSCASSPPPPTSSSLPGQSPARSDPGSRPDALTGSEWGTGHTWLWGRSHF